MFAFKIRFSFEHIALGSNLCRNSIFLTDLFKQVRTQILEQDFLLTAERADTREYSTLSICSPTAAAEMPYLDGNPNLDCVALYCINIF